VPPTSRRLIVLRKTLHSEEEIEELFQHIYAKRFLNDTASATFGIRYKMVVLGSLSPMVTGCTSVICGKIAGKAIRPPLLAKKRIKLPSYSAFSYATIRCSLSICSTVASVLVSATGALKEYEHLVRDNLREQIFELVGTEGKAWASSKVHDEGRAQRVFEPFRNHRTCLIDENFVQLILPSLAIKYAKDFMVIQRITRVLRKCGQYQDLMLLREGDNSAWTYTDKEHYKEVASGSGEPRTRNSSTGD
jgi:hypothetical protein